MEIQEFDSAVLRRILIGLITNSSFVASVSDANLHQLFPTSAENTIADLCVNFYKEYRRPVGRDIYLELGNVCERQRLKQDQIDLLQTLLSSLDVQFEHESVDDSYLFKVANDFFNDRQLRKTVDQVTTKLNNNEVQLATAELHKFRQLELGVNYGIHPLVDETAIREAFSQTSEQLIKFGVSNRNLEDASVFFGDVFSRDNLVAFLAPEKAGKTFLLLDLAWRAVKQRRKVAFFEIGDMSQSQIMMRLMQRITRRPKRFGTYQIPTKLEVDRKKNVETDPVDEFFPALDVDIALAACKELTIDKRLLKLSTHANGTVSVLTVESVLDMWMRDGWEPDVVVIDYADLLIPIDGRQEKRHQVDETWRRLRGLSQSRHCLVLTATQADAASYKAKVLDKSNFSESKTKLAHATGIIGINATPQERDQSVRRLNWIVRREGAYNELDILYIAGSLAVAMPMVFSKFAP
jgi:hypothetical protein